LHSLHLDNMCSHREYIIVIKNNWTGKTKAYPVIYTDPSKAEAKRKELNTQNETATIKDIL